jgi:hypothetical protein
MPDCAIETSKTRATHSTEELTPLPSSISPSQFTRAYFSDALIQAVPELAAVIRPIPGEADERPLGTRSTEDLLQLIDCGLYDSQIALRWGVPIHKLAKWIESNIERSKRANEARQRQAALWDWAAFQVLANAPSDRVEIIRAEKLAQHCRWRAESFNRSQYGKNLKVTHDDERPARELSTQELEIIAGGGLITIEQAEGGERGPPKSQP